MNVTNYMEKILNDPTEEALTNAGKKLRTLSTKTGGSIAYELKIFAKEVGSLASFASAKSTIMQWPKEKLTDYIRTKMKNLSKRALTMEVPEDQND